jgi:MSHA biogenesis protein MshO
MRRPCSDSTAAPGRREAGFTLLEAILVIVLTGILGAVVAVFIKGPVDAYFDTGRRAELVDAADTALRRMSRDIKLALPNSVRVSSDRQFLELLFTRDGGRYRLDTPGDPLDFSAADTSFDVLGPNIAYQAGDQIVVNNLGEAGADAYEGNTADTHVRRALSGASPGSLSLTSTQKLPAPSESNRFQIVSGAVAFLCDGGNLYRVEGYGIHASVSSAYTAALASAARRQLATGATCDFAHDGSDLLKRRALARLRLDLAREGEHVTLLHQVQIPNSP